MLILLRYINRILLPMPSDIVATIVISTSSRSFPKVGGLTTLTGLEEPQLREHLHPGMPKPLSITLGARVGYADLEIYARGGSAVSSEAEAARKSASAVVESGKRSHYLFGAKAAAISELSTLADECAEPGWDGGFAEGINPLAVANAEELILALPDGVPLPEFAPEPDGSISLDWASSPHRRFTLSVGQANRLAFAWLDGSDKGHGVAAFDGATVPSRVLEGIRSIMIRLNPATPGHSFPTCEGS